MRVPKPVGRIGDAAADHHRPVRVGAVLIVTAGVKHQRRIGATAGITAVLEEPLGQAGVKRRRPFCVSTPSFELFPFDPPLELSLS